MRLIDADALINNIDELQLKYSKELEEVADVIDRMPTIENDWRPKGKWIPLGHRMGVFKHPMSEDFKCSVCGYEVYSISGFGIHDTCMNCGADMRGEQDG